MCFAKSARHVWRGNKNWSISDLRLRRFCESSIGSGKFSHLLVEGGRDLLVRFFPEPFALQFSRIERFAKYDANSMRPGKTSRQARLTVPSPIAMSAPRSFVFDLSTPLRTRDLPASSDLRI
jgi:hypothetical protein